MHLSPSGITVKDAWSALPERFPHIGLDEFIVMPDHLHGVVITESGQPPEIRAVILGDTINSFKNIVLAAWRKGVATEGWPRYQEHLCQRAFHDRIIRDERELEATREYILGNPVRWEQKRRGYL